MDLQYVMLGEVKCRQIFLRVVRDDVPQDRREPVARAVNVLLDLCMMVRAKGHESFLSQSSKPLLQGIFHQTRNPLTVIGGTAMRLMRGAGPEVAGMAQVILDEALRLERLTRDISTLNAVEMAEPAPVVVRVEEFLAKAVEAARADMFSAGKLSPGMRLDPDHPEIEADPSLLAELFKEVLANAVEGMPPACGSLTITSLVESSTPTHLSIIVAGGGELPRGQDVEQLFLPFNSSKPRGTGFGLAIARAAARKCYGRVALSQTEEGVACTVKLPLKGFLDEAGLGAQMDF